MKQGLDKDRLIDIAKVQTGKWDANHAKKDGQYRFYTCAFKHLYCDTSRFSDECLILPGNGVNVGEVFYYSGEFDAYQRTYVVSDITINARYLYYHMLAYWKTRNLNKQYGSATNFLKIGNFQDYDIIYPKELDEQKRIVAKLDECFESIDKARANVEKNLQNAKDLFQSQLNQIFSQKGDGWIEGRLEDVCKYEKVRNEKVDLPYVGLEHIESNTGTFLGSLDPGQVKSSTFYFSSKHILYGRLRPYLNKVLIPDFEGHCSTEIFPILVNNIVKKEFLFYWLISSKTVKKIDATWTGARMPRANMNEVIKFTFSYPSIEQQEALVQKLNGLNSECDALYFSYKNELDALDELKKSILQKAFNGEL